MPSRTPKPATESADSPLRDYMSAVEAMGVLQVRAQTLYAYVSRGLIRSVVQPGHKAKLYLRDDVLRVGSRSAARSGHGAVAASAMNWGEPIIGSLITEITPAGPHYRSHAAPDLASSGVGFEAVAELLWTGSLGDAKTVWPITRSSADLMRLGRRLFAGAPGGNLLESFAMVVLLLGIERGSIEDRVRQGKTLVAARQIMQTIVGCCGFAGPAGGYVPMQRGDTVARGLMRALSIDATADNTLAFEAILILMADHELSPGTLSARVVASGGGTLHSCLAAALCTSSGVEVGRVYDRVADLLGKARSASVLSRRANAMLQQGLAVPGFNHPLYPKGDPRAVQLLGIARRRPDQTAESRAVFGFIDEMRATAGLTPRQELAIVLLMRTMGLSAPVPTAVFALARMAGWVAHVLEQRERGTLLRPRARFEHAEAGVQVDAHVDVDSTFKIEPAGG
ncbi:citrate synthase family protein [soil metagenome]